MDRQFVEPIGYLDVHVTPTGYRILPVLARVRDGFSVRFGRDEVNDTFEVPLAFLMAPQHHQREKADWNGLITSVYAISFNDRKIWGVTAGILRNLWARIYKRLIWIRLPASELPQNWRDKGAPQWAICSVELG